GGKCGLVPPDSLDSGACTAGRAVLGVIAHQELRREVGSRRVRSRPRSTRRTAVSRRPWVPVSVLLLTRWTDVDGEGVSPAALDSPLVGSLQPSIQHSVVGDDRTV